MASKEARTVRTVFRTVIAMLLLGVVGAVAVAYSGVVDVAATNRPSALTRWFLRTTRAHSVAARAEGIEVPNLDAPGTLAIGADHYHEMCVGCHGAPGVEADEAAQGLEPPPPKLDKGPPMTTERAAETFWVVKNGIQMTGMPAFGKTHDDQKIWAIVAFVGRLRGMSPADYQKATANDDEADSDDAPAAGEHAGHEHHGHATHEHAAHEHGEDLNSSE
jgi:mono/diheme cytochrome c family protein